MRNRKRRVPGVEGRWPGITKGRGGGWGHGVKIVGFRSKKRREPGVTKARGPEFFNDIKCPDRPSPICIYILMDFDN